MSSKKQKIVMFAAAAALVGAGTWAAIVQPWKKPAPVAASAISAKLELAAGEVLLEAAEGSDAKPQRLLSGTPLPEGATLSTGEGARALVRLHDGARLYLDAKTRVELREGLILHEGRVWLDAPGLDDGREPASHQLGSATVALSEGGASLELIDDQARVYVAEGLAVVSGPGGRREVGAGEQALISGQSAPEVEAVAFWDDWTGGMGDRSGLGSSLASGSGSLYAVDRSAPPGSPALPLQIQSQAVKVVMRDDIAETQVDQRFFNPSGRDVEGYYWFTIPEGSQLVGFALETNGQLIEAEIVERKQAAATYEAAVQRANDPALLEWVDDRTVRARIFPVPALGVRRTVVRYQQLLTEAEGKLRYSYPLAGPMGKQTASIEEFSLAVELGTLHERYSIATLGEARVEDEGKRVTMRRSGYTPRADFQLELTRKPGEKRDPLRLSMLDPGGDQARYVMVRYSPDVAFEAVTMPRGEVVVVVDTSAAGDPSEYQTRLAVTEALLRSLSEGDRFAVMSADVRAEVLYPAEGLADAGPQAVSEALERLAAHGTGGATDLGSIFELALEHVHGLEQPAVVYVGDGMATSGERGGDALAERLRRSMTGSRARLFTVGVGQEVDERLLSALARVGGGTSLRVEGPEQAIVRALELSGALKTPTITDLELDLGEGLDDVFYSTTGKLSRGQELVVLARTHHELPDEVTIHGRLGGEPFERTHELERVTGVTEQLVPRLWAGAYVERLMGDSRGPEAVRGKILSLGLEYGLMSPHTSFIALDSEQAYAAMGIGRRARRFGGVRLTADARHLQDERPTRRDRDRDRGALEIIGAILSAPIGCDAGDRREESADRSAPAVAAQSTPASSVDTPAPTPSMAPSSPEPDPEPELAKADDAAPPPPGGGVEVMEEDAVAEPAPAKATSAGASKSSGRKNKPALGSSSDPLEGLLGGEGKGGDGGYEDGSIVDSTRPLLDKKTPNEGRWAQPLVTSPVPRGRRLPCSDASARSLTQRRILWRERLRKVTTMTDALEVYEASAGSCEVGGWRDQRTFLDLLQARAQTEGDISLVLAHFREEADSARFVARALLRRLVDPALVAAVDNALFGTLVDWAAVDARVVLAKSIDDKLELVRDALLRAPGDPQGELRLIELLVAADRVPEAVSHGTRLREQGLMTPGLAQALGEVMVAHGQVDQAQRLFSEIVEFDPSNPTSRRLLGDIFLRHGWYDGAYRQYEDLVALHPDEPTGPIRLALAAAGTGRVDEALRTLRKLASGEGRPGADDPRRFARLHAAALLAGLLRDALAGSSEIPEAGVTRELRRLQLFDGPATWELLVWEDLEADLVLTLADPASREHVGDPIAAGHTGLFALQAPPAGLPPLTVRHAGEVLERAVGFTRITITFDGSKFTVKHGAGEVAAGQSRLVASPDSADEDDDDAGTVAPGPAPTP